MKRLLALLPLLAFCLFCAPAAFADAPVSYLDAQGVPQSCDTYTTLTDETTAWTGGWYLAEGTVTISKKVTVTGDVHLILADGASVTTGNIEVADGNALTLYAQSAGPDQGSLQAQSDDPAAAIGGSSQAPQSSGAITINGGTVTAITTGSGAAISGSSVTIQGGTVTAQSNGSCDIYGTFSTGTNGSARIYADTISDTSAQSSWSCLWVQKDAATVYGSIILTDDMTLDRPLTVYANGQLTVNGTLTCQKGLVNNGILTNNGTVLVAGGDLDNRGTLAIAATGTLHINGTPDAPRTLTNNGTLTVNGSLELDDTTLQNDSGTLDGTGLCVLTDKSEITGGNTTLRVEYRIFLDGNGATLTDTMLVTVEHKPVRLPTPTREDYRFDGWFTQAEGGTQVTAETTLTASQTVYAHWTLTATPTPTPTPTATPSPTPTPTASPSPTPTAAPTPTPVVTPTPVPTPTATPVPTAKPTATPKPATPKPTAAPTATPKPTPLEMHTLHFNTMGGLPLADVKFGLGAPVELWPYTPSRPGYLFMGWYADEALTQPVGTIVLVKDTTIYAKWVVDPAAAAASQGGSGSGSSGSGSGGSGSSSKATPTPEPTATPEPTPTATPTPEPTATPEPTTAPENTEDDAQGGLPILPIAGGVAALAVIGGVVFYLRRKTRDDGHYHRR